MIASLKGHVKSVRYLLQQGADVNAEDVHGVYLRQKIFLICIGCFLLRAPFSFEIGND